MMSIDEKDIRNSNIAGLILVTMVSKFAISQSEAFSDCPDDTLRYQITDLIMVGNYWRDFEFVWSRHGFFLNCARPGKKIRAMSPPNSPYVSPNHAKRVLLGIANIFQL